MLIGFHVAATNVYDELKKYLCSPVDFRVKDHCFASRPTIAKDWGHIVICRYSMGLTCNKLKCILDVR